MHQYSDRQASLPRAQPAAQAPSLASIAAAFERALIAGDRVACTRITEQAMAKGVSTVDLYEHIFRPALYEVGALWAANRISVATEHLATDIVEGLLNRIYPALINAERCGRKAVLTTVEGETHQVGIRMVADLLEMYGWDSILLGAGSSTDKLLALIKTERPDLVAVSLCVGWHLDALERVLARLRAEHPALPVLVGGQGIDQGADRVVAKYLGVACVRDLAALEALLGPRGTP